MSPDLVISDLCIQCFQNKGHSGSVCPSCHFNEQHYKGHPLFLKPRSALKGYYWIGKPLGQGGFGITYLGLDRWLQKKVAIKEYLPSALATRDFLTATVIPIKPQETAFHQGLQLFIDEARNLAKFDHPHIVRVTHFFEENQTAYMVMDYLEGNNAEAIVNQAGQLMAVESALAIVLPILKALHTIHQQHLYHRDISLQNIRILTDGTPVLIDFGAARHIVGTQSHSLDLVLKQGYSPLEQYSGKGKIGPWTDIYACSAVLYTLLTNQLPPPSPDRFCGDNLTPLGVLRPEIPENIQKAVMQALSIQPEERFQTVTAFIEALTANLSSPLTEPSPANPTPHLISIPNPISLFPKLYFIPLLLTLFTTAFYSPPLSLFPLNQLLAQAHHARNNAHYEQAYQTYRYILQHWPLEPTAQRELNQLFDDIYQRAQQTHQTQQWTSSLQWTQLGLKIKPEDIHLNALQTHNNIQLAHTQQLQEADHHSQNGQLEQAYNLYQKILQDHPQHPGAQQGLARLAQHYQQRAEIDPNLLPSALQKFPTHAGLRNLHQQQTQHWITQQLKKAQQQLLALRLTEPLGDNAYQTYQAILNTVPNHPEAQQGLLKIAQEYLKLAQIKQDNLQKNLDLIDKGLRVVPTHPELQTLRNQLLMESQLPPKLSSPLTAIQSSPTPPTSTKVPVPAQTIAVPKTISPPNSSTTSSIPTPTKPMPTPKDDDPILKLLATANHYLQTGQFDEATQAYHNILLTVPTHSPAQQQLQYIANHYRQLAQQYYQQQQFSEALSNVQKGLLATPSDPDLLTLQAQLQQTQHTTPQNNPLPEQKVPEKNPNLLFTPSF